MLVVLADMFSAFASAELFKLSCVARSAALTVDEFFAIFSEQLPAVLRDEWPVYFRDDLCGLSLVFLSNLLFVLLTVLSLLFLDGLSVLLMSGVLVLFLDGLSVLLMSGVLVLFLDDLSVLLMSGVLALFLDGLSVLLMSGVLVLFLVGLSVLLMSGVLVLFLLDLSVLTAAKGAGAPFTADLLLLAGPAAASSTDLLAAVFADVSFTLAAFWASITAIERNFLLQADSAAATASDLNFFLGPRELTAGGER